MEDGHGAKAEERESPLGARLEQLLATLPEPQRAALVLRYQEDLTPEEIAATLEAPLATVKSHLQRGLKLLRAKAATHLKEYVRVSEAVRIQEPGVTAQQPTVTVKEQTNGV
jgi:RNA polymerase sigma-70 factor (ECF subfamily)